MVYDAPIQEPAPAYHSFHFENRGYELLYVGKECSV